VSIYCDRRTLAPASPILFPAPLKPAQTTELIQIVPRK